MSHIDKVFKKRLEEAFLGIISQQLSLHFEKESIEQKPAEFASESLRADFVFELKRKGQREIWHIEEQTQDDARMIERMLKYLALLYDKHKLPVYQVVIFVGAKSVQKSQMKHQAKIGFFEYQYKLLNLGEIPYTDFLQSPQTLPFAILGKYKDLKKVLKQIGEKSKLFLRKREEFLNLANDLLLLAKKREIEKEVINLIPTFMPLLLDYKETQTFKDGKLEGELEGKLKVARALIGKMSLQEIANVTGIALAEIEKLVHSSKKK